VVVVVGAAVVAVVDCTGCVEVVVAGEYGDSGEGDDRHGCDATHRGSVCAGFIPPVVLITRSESLPT
jgi:hypothetical protein